jgi:protein-disulfide isomerase
VVAAVALAVALTRGSSAKPETAALPGAADVNALLRGIPQQGNVLGKSTAPVTLVEYVDLQCPFCQAFETSAMPTLMRRYVRPGKLKVVMRPIAFIGPDSVRGQHAVLAAGRQNRLFDLAQILYVNQGEENTGWLTDSTVKAAAKSIRLDGAKVLAEAGSSAVADEARAATAQATEDGVTATPTIFVGKSGTKPRAVALKSPTDEQSVAGAIDAALTS